MVGPASLPGELSGFAEAVADRYRIERELGRGGMAIVLLAEDLRHRRKVALKVLRPELTHQVGADRFLREIATIGRLAHPNILPLHDSGEGAGMLYYVMPYVEGESLRERLVRERQLPVEETLRIVRQVGDALTFAHAAGIVHRDVKPENVLLVAGQAIVADFGIARIVNAADTEKLTGTGLAIGTPAYMSPEQATGEGHVDGRSDTYSLACMAYEMLGGTAPFSGPSPQAVMARHAVDPMPPLRSVRPTVTEAVERVLSKGMAKVPADRFESPAAFAADLDRAFAGAETSEPRYAKLRSRSAVSLALAAAAVIIFALAGGRNLIAPEEAELESIAVLPLSNITGSTDEEHFVAGMHESLVGALGQLRSVRVVWAPPQRYTNTNRSISEIARELNVDGVVTGAVLRSSDSVQLQVRLIRARPDEQLVWSQDYRRPMREVLSLHGEVARVVANRSRGRRGRVAEGAPHPRRSIDPASYEAYLRGMYLLNKSTREEHLEGIRYLEDAIRKNPGDPYAYAGLALGYATVGHGPGAPADIWQRARAAALRAVTLDSSLAEGHLALAQLKMYREYDWDGAEQSFQRVFELNPNLAMAHYHYSWYLILFRRDAEAIAEHLRAQELDPLTPLHTAHLAWLYLIVGDQAKAMEEAQKTLEMDDRSALGKHVTALAHRAAGNYDQAIAMLREASEISPRWSAFLAETYFEAGRVAEGKALLAEIERRPLTPYNAFVRGMLHARFGDLDEAFRMFNHRPAHAWLPWVRVMFGHDRLGADPRYRDLLASVNLTP